MLHYWSIRTTDKNVLKVRHCVTQTSVLSAFDRQPRPGIYSWTHFKQLLQFKKQHSDTFSVHVPVVNTLYSKSLLYNVCLQNCRWVLAFKYICKTFTSLVVHDGSEHQIHNSRHAAHRVIFFLQWLLPSLLVWT